MCKKHFFYMVFWTWCSKIIFFVWFFGFRRGQRIIFKIWVTHVGACFFYCPIHRGVLRSPPPSLPPSLIYTFEFPVERSNFRSNVRISDRTFEFPAERSKFWSNAWENEEWKLEFGTQKRASRIFRWSKMDLLSTNFNMQRSKISNVIEKLPQMTKNKFYFFSKLFI